MQFLSEDEILKSFAWGENGFLYDYSIRVRH